MYKADDKPQRSSHYPRWHCLCWYSPIRSVYISKAREMPGPRVVIRTKKKVTFWWRMRRRRAEHSAGTYTSESKWNITSSFFLRTHLCKSSCGVGERTRDGVGPRWRRWWVLTVSIYAKLLLSINPENHKDSRRIRFFNRLWYFHRHSLSFLSTISPFCAAAVLSFSYTIFMCVRWCRRAPNRDDRKGQCAHTCMHAASEYE